MLNPKRTTHGVAVRLPVIVTCSLVSLFLRLKNVRPSHNSRFMAPSRFAAVNPDLRASPLLLRSQPTHSPPQRYTVTSPSAHPKMRPKSPTTNSTMAANLQSILVRPPTRCKRTITITAASTTTRAHPQPTMSPKNACTQTCFPAPKPSPSHHRQSQSLPSHQTPLHHCHSRVRYLHYPLN